MARKTTRSTRGAKKPKRAAAVKKAKKNASKARKAKKLKKTESRKPKRAKKTAKPRTVSTTRRSAPAAKRTARAAQKSAAVADEAPDFLSDSALPDVTPADLSGLAEGKLYYRIGEVSQITGVKPYVLRYWESEFRLMSPQKSRSKQRLYRQKDIETILHIKRLLYEERYTIAGARKQLRLLGADRVREESRLRHRLDAKDPRHAPVEPAPPLAATDGFAGVLAELREIRSALAADL